MAINVIHARDLEDEQLVQDVHSMQQEAAKEVPFMDVLQPEEIQELVKDGALYCICDDAEKIPLASLYIKDTGLESAQGKKVYALGGLSFFPGQTGNFLSQLSDSTDAVREVLDRDYSDKTIISSTHQKFTGALSSLGFRQISLEEISRNHPELLAYFQKRDPTLIRFIREAL